MNIYTEGTPNPNALKFVLDKQILEKGSFNFPNKESAKSSNLVLKIFEIPNIKEVLLGIDFITVSKAQNENWDNIYQRIIDTITNYISSGEEIISITETATSYDENISEIERKIREILDKKIRPAVASDGGDIIFGSYEDGILKLHLQGSCSHCPSSTMTLKAGIESMLKREIPELKEVISV